MNKYDFDFRKIEDVLYDVLGIVDPTNLMSLKMQIRESLNALSEAIDKKSIYLEGSQEEKIEKQKSALFKELDEITNETDLDTVLRKCITIRYLTLLSLEVKIRPEDSYDERAKKQNMRNEIFAVSNLIKSVPSIIELIEKRDWLLNYIDAEHRIVPVDHKPPKNTDMESFYPATQLRFQFTKGDAVPFQDECGQILEEAGIHAFRFGELIYSTFPDAQGTYTQQLARKNLVGIVKKDEFGDTKKYCVLMDAVNPKINPEFYRDIMFSDMLLRNSKNNFGFLGVPELLPEDSWYGYKVGFKDLYIEDMLRAIYFENDSKSVSVKADPAHSEIRSLSDAYEMMQKKMEKMISNRSDKSIGDE